MSDQDDEADHLTRPCGIDERRMRDRQMAMVARARSTSGVWPGVDAAADIAELAALTGDLAVGGPLEGPDAVLQAEVRAWLEKGIS